MTRVPHLAATPRSRGTVVLCVLLGLGVAGCDPVAAPAPGGATTTAASTTTPPPGSPSGTVTSSAGAATSTSLTTPQPSTTPATTTTRPTGTTATTTTTTTTGTTTTGTTPATTPATTTTTGTTTPSTADIAQQAARAVFDATNAARADAGLPALTWNAALVRSAAAHDDAMAAAGTLSHQLPGEPALGARVTAQGVRWTSAGENIGWTSQRTVAGALSLHTSMINEVPPADGHRRNKLSPDFTQLGVAVLIDPGTGRLWLTEDYARL